MKRNIVLRALVLLTLLTLLLTACTTGGNGTPTGCSGAHSYDNACDTDCGVCGATRTPTTHAFDGCTDGDCNVCGATRTPTTHAFDGCTDGDCNECGATRTPAAHAFDGCTDGDCNECGATRTPAAHKDENTDGECDECGEEVEIPGPVLPNLSQLLATVPTFDNSVEYISLNGDLPLFIASELTTVSFAKYSELDALGRAGVAMGCLGKDLLDYGARDTLDNPTGWQGNSIYERSHLIAHVLAGEDGLKNLITGTYDLNGVMQEFEEMVKDYIVETSNHVMYRVTPIYEGNNLVASGVVMEGYSVEDNGEGICFFIYIYNEQDDEIIDHATGKVTLPEREYHFVVNKSNYKIHTADCRNVAGMSDENKLYYSCSYAELVEILRANGKSFTNGDCCRPQNSTAGSEGGNDGTQEPSGEETAYYMSFVTGGVTYYFTGSVSSGKGATTTDKSRAAVIYVLAVDGGYHIYMKASDGKKTYLSIGTTTTSLTLGDTPFLFVKDAGGSHFISPESKRTFALYAKNLDVRTYLTTQSGLVGAKFIPV